MDVRRKKANALKSVYRPDRAARNMRVGGAIGGTAGALAGMLLSRWISEEFLWLIVAVCAAIGTVAFGFIWPADMGYYDFEHDAENIEPAERVERLHARRGESESTTSV